MKFPAPLIQPLAKALEDAFPTFAKLDAMLFFKFNVVHDKFGGTALPDVIVNMIVDFQSSHETSELLFKAREANPKNVMLLEVARRAGLGFESFIKNPFDMSFAPTNVDTLERTVKEKIPALDVTVWREKLSELEGRVCRIEYKIGGNPVTGTGFLVADGIVLTNYHVMEEVIRGKVKPEDVVLRFDFKVLSDGTTINSGTIVKLAAGDGWLVDSSPYSEVDILIDPQDKKVGKEELDYALLQLAEDIGAAPIGANSHPSDPLRGYIRVSDSAYDFPHDTALFILQHPDGKPLKLVLDTNAIIGVDIERTRVRYQTNTEKGSSGSPCFNANWDLVALHHSGDPNYAPLHKPTYNQGIPIDSVRALLKSRSKDSFLGN